MKKIKTVEEENCFFFTHELRKIITDLVNEDNYSDELFDIELPAKKFNFYQKRKNTPTN